MNESDLKTLQFQKSNMKKSNCVCQSESGCSLLALIQECSGPEDKPSHLGKCCGPMCVCVDVCVDASSELSRRDTHVWQLQTQWFHMWETARSTPLCPDVDLSFSILRVYLSANVCVCLLYHSFKTLNMFYYIKQSFWHLASLHYELFQT